MRSGSPTGTTVLSSQLGEAVLANRRRAAWMTAPTGLHFRTLPHKAIHNVRPYFGSSTRRVERPQRSSRTIAESIIDDPAQVRDPGLGQIIHPARRRKHV
jgi:hypothetical protein